MTPVMLIQPVSILFFILWVEKMLTKREEKNSIMKVSYESVFVICYLVYCCRISLLQTFPHCWEEKSHYMNQTHLHY
jgi:hypothetical protein